MKHAGKGAGLAYKRNQRRKKIRRETEAKLREYRDSRRWSGASEPGVSFLDAPDTRELFRTAGRYAKRSSGAGQNSGDGKAKRCFRYYAVRDIRNAFRALSEYDDHGIPADASNRSEATKRIRDADRRSVRFRKG